MGFAALIRRFRAEWRASDCGPGRAVVASVVMAVALMGAACNLNPAESGGGGGEGGFYDGETIEIVVPFEEGGGTDIWARFMASQLEGHIEGSPTITISNQAEGEGIVATNEFATTPEEDGTQLLASSGTTMFHQQLGRPEVEYDFTELTPVVVSKSGGVMFANPETGLETAEDIDGSRQLKYGGISPTGLDLVPLLTFELLDMNVQSVFGIEGRGPALLAFQRGETTIDYQTTSSYKSSVEDLVDENKASPLASFGVLAESGELERDPTLKDIPTVAEAVEDVQGHAPQGELWEAYLAFMGTGFTYQKALWLPPEAPEEAVTAIEDGVAAMIEDPEFAQKGEEALGGYPTFVGSDIRDEFFSAFEIDEDTRRFVQDFLARNYDVEF